MKKKLIISQEFKNTLCKAQNFLEIEELVYYEYTALKIISLLQTKDSTQSTILDLGCGNGLLTRLVQILCNPFAMHAIDINHENIKYAQKEFPAINFQQSAQGQIPFPDETFDIVYAHEVIHHIPHQLHQLYFSEIYRVLKPGGIALLIEFNPYNPWTRHVFKHNPEEQELTMLTPKYIRKLAQPYGLVIIHYFGFFQRWFTQLRFLEKYLCKIPLGSLYAAIVHKNK